MDKEITPSGRLMGMGGGTYIRMKITDKISPKESYVQGPCLPLVPHRIMVDVRKAKKRRVMARRMLLFLLLLIFIATISQFRRWKQLVGRTQFQKKHQISDVEADLEDSIVLMQEKSINKLNELVQDLKEQLQQCRSSKSVPTYYVRKNNSKFAPT